jgi:hypothetical protein
VLIIGLAPVISKQLYVLTIELNDSGITGLGSVDSQDFVLVNWPIHYL